MLFYVKDVMVNLIWLEQTYTRCLYFYMDYCYHVHSIVHREIERQLEHMGEIRRDKWVVEGKLRRWATWIDRILRSIVIINASILLLKNTRENSSV